MSEQPDPYAGETRAERRRRRLAAEAAREEAARARSFQTTDPYDVSRRLPDASAPAGDAADAPTEAAPARPPLPRPSLRRPSSLTDPPPADPAAGEPTPANPATANPATANPAIANPATANPASPRPGSVGDVSADVGADVTKGASTGVSTGVSTGISADVNMGISTNTPADDGTYSPRSARRKPNVAPLADIAADDDPAAAAAALQLLAAQVAAARLRSSARGAASRSTPAPGSRTDTGRPSDPAKTSGTASRTPTADALAAARVAAARAAARQQADAGTLRRKQITAGPDASAGTGAGSGPAAQSASPSTRAATPAITSASTPAGDTRAARRRRRTASRPPAGRPTSRSTGAGRENPWRHRAFAVAALLVIGGGTALSIPHIGALLTQPPGAEQSAAPTGAASPDPDQPSADSPAPDGSAPAVAPACSGQDIAGTLKPGDAAAAVFGAQTVGDAYCYVAGVLRDQSFTDLAVRRAAGQPYAATDFAPMRAHLSEDLAAAYDKDVAALVASQNPGSDEGRRLSALTRLAWDNGQLRFDPSATAKASKFEAGPPVTWTAKGADGVDRMGLGFETGVVTHMVDAAGRPAPYVLKRTYKLALVKGDGPRPWLIDAYDVGESTAALVTVTPGAATPTARATSPAATATTRR